MKTFIIGILTGIIVGVGSVWYFTVGRTTPEVQQVEERASIRIEEVGDSAREAVEEARQAIQARLEAWELRPEDIQEELADQGEIIRRKSRVMGETVTDAAADAKITATVKARLAADPELSAFDVSVSTTEGKVTLSGKVESAEQIGRAVALALETSDVQKVVSVLEVE